MTLDLFEVPLDSRYSKLHHYRAFGELAAPAENLYSSFIRCIGTDRAHSYARKAVRNA